MGKSTVAGLFAEAGDAVYDADAAVHRLYTGAAVEPVGARFPEAIVDGRVDRTRLGKAVFGNAAAMADLEAIVHPLVHAQERDFLDAARARGGRIAILDIPLLFETKRDGDMDAVVVVSAPASVQRERVLARPGMTEERFEAIVAKQTPDAQKRQGAHFVIDTGADIEGTRQQVRAVRQALFRLAEKSGAPTAAPQMGKG